MDATVSFLRSLAGRRFRYGETDCVLVLADWLLATGRNRDIAEGFRGTYSTEADCGAVLAAQGGVLRVVARHAREMNLPSVEPSAAPAGAIGVVRYQAKHYGAIRTPAGRWAIKCNDGLVMVQNPRVVAAWRVV